MPVTRGYLRKSPTQPIWVPATDLAGPERLRLLSFNFQVGIRTCAYHHYLTRCWKHLLPHSERNLNLSLASSLLSDFDIVALQEVDGGSLRTGQLNQVQQLAEQGGFSYWYQQLNRNLAPFAQHSNGLLSRLQPNQVEDHALPGPRGRGAILARYQLGSSPVAIIMMHLALGRKARNLQLGYIRELTSDFQHFVLMGDMNAQADDLLLNSPLTALNLHNAQQQATFPSWNPIRCLDHILLSPGLQASQDRVIPYPLSDHLPVATEIRLSDPS